MGLVDDFRKPAKPSSKKCSQSPCKESAVGTVQMANGKWVRVCKPHKKIMGIPRRGPSPRSETAVAPRHGTGEEKVPSPNGGRHRAHP